MLLALFGVAQLMALTPVLIPSSVICMLVVFLGLLALEWLLGTRRVKGILRVIELGTGFSLTWISLFFTPSFVLLPLAESVSVAEAFEIGGVFVVGWFATMALMVYVVWGLQWAIGKTRKATSEDTYFTYNENNTTASSAVELLSLPNTPYSVATPPAVAEITRPNNPGVSVPYDEDDDGLTASSPIQEPPVEQQLAERPKKIAAWIAAQFDYLVYWTLFIVGLGVYFGTSYAMPVQLATLALAFKYALLIPAKYKVFLHPILICAGISIFVYFLLARLYGEPLDNILHRFKTGRNYLTLFSKTDVLPGAGDVISTLLDTSIVVLAIPMYNYRSDLKHNFVPLTVPSIVAALASFFVYPPLCYAVGISNTRSLAFVARSATLALALPVVDALQGSDTLVAVVAILSGILGVLLGSFVLGKRCLRVREDDYVTRGVTLGINSSAVASAHLLTSDPRAGALSSLSFFLYGTLLIILAAITPLANLIRAWVDLPPL